MPLTREVSCQPTAAAAADDSRPYRGGSHVAVGLAGIAIFGVLEFLTYYLQVVKG
jgi:hypothetical protein